MSRDLEKLGAYITADPYAVTESDGDNATSQELDAGRRGDEIDLAMKGLWAAVFTQAIEDLENPGRIEKREANKVYCRARRWFLKKDDYRIGTFLWCCNLFGLDPLATRTALGLTVYSTAEQRARNSRFTLKGN
jgi:hypothetical protein